MQWERSETISSFLGILYTASVKKLPKKVPIINIIAYKKPGYKVMMCGHLDTVDVGNGWTKDPFVCSYETRENQTLVLDEERVT